MESTDVYVHTFAVGGGDTAVNITYTEDDKFLEDVGDVTQLYQMGPWLYVKYVKDSYAFVDQYSLSHNDIYAKTRKGQWSIHEHYTICLPWLPDQEALVCFDDMNYKLKMVFKDGRSEVELATLGETIIPGNMQLMGSDSIIFYEEQGDTGLGSTTVLSYNRETEEIKTENFLDKFTLKGGTDYEDLVDTMLGFPGDGYKLYFAGYTDGLHEATSVAPISLDMMR